VIDPRVGFVRDSFSGMALVLDLLASTGEPLSKLVDALPKYAMVKESYPRGDGDPGPLFDRLAAAYPEAEADRHDGLRLAWPDGWAHVRASNTEPIVRVIVEAPTTGDAHAWADAIGRRIAPGGREP
jgi:phosphomannomutase